MACDHTRPVCLRCRKRKQDRHCVYTISSTTVETSQVITPSASVIAPITHQDDRGASISPIRTTLASPSTERSINSNSPKNTRVSTSRTHGYLGYTSYCTVIDETLSILNGQPEDVAHSPCMEDCSVSISPQTLAVGVTILRHVPYPEDGQRFFRKDCKIYDGWLRLVAQRILDTLYVEWGKYLDRGRSILKLEDMARRISVNTAKSVLNKAEPDAWLDQFRGPNLRWESLGTRRCPRNL